MIEKLRGLGHVLRIKDDRLPKIVLLANRLGLNRKQVVLGWAGRMSQGKI